MPSTVHITTSWLVMTGVEIAFVVAYPLVLAWIVRRKLGVSWKYFWFGALVFLVVQLLTRIPVVVALQATVLAPILKASNTFVWIWLVILALTAGLFEEVGRYLGYRMFMRREEKTWNKAVMFGLGHGGLESMILVGGALSLTVVNVLVTSTLNLNSLPVAEHTLIVKQFATLNAQPLWTPLVGAWERLWTLPVHVALSVVVLQVFRRHNIAWLFLAIGVHACFDFISVAIPQIWGSTASVALMLEGTIMVGGLISVWIIWRLREPERPLVQDIVNEPAIAS